MASTLSTSCSPSGVCASLATSSTTSDIYVQISAPSTSGWAAVGIGRQMRGALMFIVYPDGNGGVTVSTRLGTGQREPDVAGGMEVEVMDAGVRGGRMVADVKCEFTTSF